VRLKRALAHEVLVEESKRLVVHIKRLAPDRRCFKKGGRGRSSAWSHARRARNCLTRNSLHYNLKDDLARKTLCAPVSVYLTF
jgi:hypothetical protein